jgi:dihydroorotate dehydrogenase
VYKLIIRPLLFLFQPESIHHFSSWFLKVAFAIPGVKWLVKKSYTTHEKTLEREVFGLKFTNPIGLAAGFDKNASMIDQLDAFDFGFIEIGTLTPKAQPGNPKPRIFRLVKDGALINRLGFNNEGVDEAVRKLKARSSSVLIGGNIGKNKVTDNADAVLDYELCFEALFEVVDYFVVNISSPNTPNLRDLQEKEPLKALLMRLQANNEAREASKPILLKIAPDLTDGQLSDIVDIVKTTKIAGLIATNTTISRDRLCTSKKELTNIGVGGLSGAPLTERANEVMKYLRKSLGSEFPIIGVGGIMTVNDAVERLRAGATLIQVYTGFVYNGPGFIKKINRAIAEADL